MTAIVTRTDLDAVVGTMNVDKWADLSNNNDADEIATRVTYCCELATAWIRGRLRLLTYDLTEVLEDSIIKHITAIKACDLLYGPRKPNDADPEKDMMRSYRKEMNDTIKEIASGQLDLGLTRKTRPYPKVVRCDRETIDLEASNLGVIGHEDT